MPHHNAIMACRLHYCRQVKLERKTRIYKRGYTGQQTVYKDRNILRRNTTQIKFVWKYFQHTAYRLPKSIQVCLQRQRSKRILLFYIQIYNILNSIFKHYDGILLLLLCDSNISREDWKGPRRSLCSPYVYLK